MLIYLSLLILFVPIIITAVTITVHYNDYLMFLFLLFNISFLHDKK